MKPISVIGEGAWGTAIASVLANNGYTVKLWCHNVANVENITQTRCNMRYMPSIKLSENIIPTASLKEAIEGVDWIFEAIPIKFLRAVIEQSAPFVKNQRWIVLSKGIEQKSLLLPSEIIQEIIPQSEIAVIVGPSFARDVILQQPTAVMLAATDHATAQSLQPIITTNYFKTIITDDVVGVQLCAAFKNLVALAVGIVQAKGYSDNTRALMITAGLCEMKRLVIACGGKESTVYGLAGLGDLLLTATSAQSRNVLVGKQLGQGKSLEEILSSGVIPEGINTLESMHMLMQSSNIKLPLTKALYRVVSGHMSIEALIEKILILSCE